MSITLCVVNFNGERYLSETLARVREIRDTFDQILLVDNASKDSSLAMVRRDFPEVSVIELGKNLGPGTARNAGYAAAVNDHILFIDNDVMLTPDCPRLLVDALKRNSDAVMAMPTVVYAKAPMRVQYDGATPHFLGLVALDHTDLPIAAVSPAVRDIDSLISACFLLDRSRWWLGPPFDESFFLYFEDHELGLRARLLGHRILSVPRARCVHGEGTVGVSLRETGRYTAIRIYHTIRNRWQVLLKLYQIRTLIVLSPVLVLFEFFQLGGVLAKGWLREWSRAIWWIVTHVPEIRRRRREFQRSRRQPDRHVLHGGPIPFTRRLHANRLERMGRTVLDAAVSRYWKLARRLI